MSVSPIDSLVTKFVADLEAAFRSSMIENLKAHGSSPPLRKKGPIQLCPVPRCTGRAAPVFNMVCSKHKDLPKAKIKKFREDRKAKAAKAKKAKAGR